MTMKTISVSQAKATLSEQLRRVQAGQEVVIADRGRPVARLVQVTPEGGSELDDLVRAGLLQRGKGVGDAFFARRRPKDPGAGVREALRKEREGGW